MVPESARQAESSIRQLDGTQAVAIAVDEDAMGCWAVTASDE